LAIDSIATRLRAAPEPGDRLLGLDLLRGAAAFLVFLHHAVVWGGADFGPLTPLAQGGRIGVLIFFALSGFVIGRRILAGVELRTYAMGRALRVLPAYYVALAGMVLLAVLFAGGRTDPLLPYLFLVSGHTMDASPFFSQAWTLTVEAEFYLVIPFIALLRGPWLLFGAGLSVVLALMPLQLGLLQFAWAFVPGLALARIERDRPGLYGRLTSSPALVIGIVATTALLLVNPDPKVGIVGVPATILLVAGCARNVPEWMRGPARWAGDLSYPFYLWHQFPVALFGATVGLLVGLAGSIVSVTLVESPIRRWFAARRSQVRIRTAPATA
jgi:peptidoglycan/LPS O-acetylase OafA/YrhL